MGALNSIPTDQLEAYIESGFSDEHSPFIKRNSKFLSKNTGLKSALLAACFLLASYALYAFYPPVANLCLLFVYLLAGTHALIESIDDLFHMKVNIDVLMTLAAFFSIVIGSPYEGGLLLVLFAISEAMEAATTQKTTTSLQSLHKLTPQKALVVRGENDFIEKSIEDVKPGDHIFIKVGATIPLDGVIIEGSCDLNLAHLTGEPVPIAKGPKDNVPAGAIATDGSLKIQVTTTSSDSTLSRIVELITKAQSSKPKIARFFDRFSQAYALTIIGLAAIFALTLPLFTRAGYLGSEGSIFRSLAFLIAASPCALIIAVPTAYLSAVSSCAKRGILLKGGVILDALAKCRTFIFDKTGTLTTAELTLEDVTADASADKNQLLQVAASLEKSSTHPIGIALIKKAKENKLSLLQVDHFEEVPGFGLKGRISGKEALIGHKGFIEKEQPEALKQMQEKLNELHEAGLILCLLFFDGKLSVFTFSDTLKKGSRRVVSDLRREGLDVVMLTGDHSYSAKRIASALGIKNVFSDLRPEDKLSKVKAIQKKSPAAMFGDGINDAPALAKAYVGISMGNLGSDTAIEASDIVLLQDRIELTSFLVKKAHACMRIVNQNLIFAVGVITVVSTLALMGFVPLWLAVILHEGGTVAVALNGLRLLTKK
jgi:Zn2+/Cd2+-exporting ATPase